MLSDRKSLHCTIVGQFFWVKIIPAIIKYTCYLTENVHLCRITKWRTRALALLTIDMSEILRGAKISPLFFGSFNLDFWLWCANGKLLRNLVHFQHSISVPIKSSKNYAFKNKAEISVVLYFSDTLIWGLSFSVFQNILLLLLY